MYFDHAGTLAWCRATKEKAERHPSIESGRAELVVLPGFAELSDAARIFAGGPVLLGAQDLSWEDRGAFTGEVSGRQLAQVGCRYVEIGHAERRRLFHEDDRMLAAKVAAAFRNELTPILCVGEPDDVGVDAAVEFCIRQLESLVASVSGAPGSGDAPAVVVAYEPVWAIGAEKPASTEHIRGVCSALKSWLGARPALGGSRVIYGGSAGPGLFGELGSAVDGLFLGRFAHDPDAMTAILDEAEQSDG
jgi:triosephosphate isomerase